MKIDRSKDIAIIGMSALFPKAPDLNTYWDNLLNRVDAITDPMPGWGHEISMDPGSDHINRVYTKRGGFLGGLGDFDPARFGIMPNSVPGGEPDQFIALNLAADALEDAGYGNGNFNSQNTGIILGHGIHANRANTNGIQIGLVLDQTLMILESLFPGMPQDVKEGFSDLFKSKLPSLNPDSVPGLVPNMMTGRIANRLNLMGPNYILDGACASSLIAIDSAITELIRGRADMMLAGGINTTSSILVYMVFCQLGALSRSSRIRPFDTGADGTLLGEGAGIVVLKRYEDALRDNDRVYAVIKGVGISSDGRAKGMMAPRLEGEVLAMERAYKEADLSPESVELMEAHGTGIPLGDKTEIQALKAVMGERKGPFPTCALGSVKSMIGHCIPAAGIASVIKCSLALYHKLLPPMICNEVDKSLGIEETSFYVNTELRPWIHTGQTP
ncbi:MAG: polyketide synthase, partial [Deltaproteobacteria bacterium]|nr:polyketide synthase [Deltaproteobacteria bacterium]